MSPQDQQACAAAIVTGLVSVAMNSKFASCSRPNLNRGSNCSDRNAEPQQTTYPENDVPQPQDFCAFGFTKTNPCCIKVSL